jgi:hypothetical protein
VAVDKRFEDDRPARRARSGLGAGGAIGAGLGAALALLTGSVPLVLTLTGAVLGALAGRRVTASIAVDEWDRRPDRPHVGAKAPDVA